MALYLIRSPNVQTGREPPLRGNNMSETFSGVYNGRAVKIQIDDEGLIERVSDASGAIPLTEENITDLEREYENTIYNILQEIDRDAKDWYRHISGESSWRRFV